jgi:DNA-binding NarL/FixJ family response regulator
MTMVSVLVAEDHPMFRDALQATLTLAGGFEVVAAVGSGKDAVAEALRHTPDVVVMDLEMPGSGGVAATAEILRQLPATRILVLTSYDEDRLVYAALRAGAHGYVLKSATTEEIVRAVQTVAQGDGLFAGSVVERISRHLATGGRASAPSPFPELTPREREILELMAQGHSNAYIADHFVLSLKTVRNHVSNILAKLGTSTRAEAVVKAHQAGLGGHTDRPGSSG